MLSESTGSRVIDVEGSGLLQPQAANEEGGAWPQDLVQLILPALVLPELLSSLQRYSPNGSQQMLRAIEVLIQPNPTRPVGGRSFEVLVAHMVRSHQYAAVLAGELHIPLSELLPGAAGDEELLQKQVNQQAISSWPALLSYEQQLASIIHWLLPQTERSQSGSATERRPQHCHAQPADQQQSFSGDLSHAVHDTVRRQGMGITRLVSLVRPDIAIAVNFAQPCL